MAEPDNAQLAYLIAEAGIRRLYGLYADAVWRKDGDAFGACFTHDAVWKIAGRTMKGRAEIVQGFLASLEPSERVMMWLGIPVLEVGEGTATGRVQVTELIKRKTGESQRTLAYYYERFVETGGVWRIAWHHFNLYYLGPTDLSGDYIECMEYGPPPALAGLDDPTSVPVR